MAAVQLVACALLLAARVPAAPAGRPPLQGTPRTSWGPRQPGSAHPGDTSGQFSGAGDPDGERWGAARPTWWSPPLGAVTRTPTTSVSPGADDSLQAPGVVATSASTGPGARRDGGPTLEVMGEPYITWRGREAQGQAGRWMETWMPLTVPTDVGRGTRMEARVPTDAGRGTLGPAEPHGLVPVRTPSAQPTMSTIALHSIWRGLDEGGTTGAPASPPRSIPAFPTTVPSSAPGPPAWEPGRAEQTALEGRADTWTMELPAQLHQRSTRRAPLANGTAGHVAPYTTAAPRTAASPHTTVIPHTTTTPHTITTPRSTTAPRSTAVPGTPAPASGTHPAAPTASGPAAPWTLRAGTAPEEELGSPQRVRGALVPQNGTEVAVSATRTPGPRRSGATATQPPRPGTAAPSSMWHPALPGVTPQRALPHPNATAAPEPIPPCPADAEPCGAPRGNASVPRWAEAPRALRVAWDAQLCAAAALFVLLSAGCVGALLGTAALRPPRLPLVLLALALLLGAGIARAVLLLWDPYGARGRLPRGAVLLLATAPFPLLLAAFAVLLQLLQRRAQLPLLPLPALAAAAALPATALPAADLLAPRLGPGLALHALGCAVGALLLLAGLRGCWRLLCVPGAAGCSEFPALRRGARALAAAAVLGLPCCGLQLYSTLWLWGALGPPGRLSWPCWAAQLALRLCELATALALLVSATEPLCCAQPHGAAGTATDHSCWAKALRYFCAARKAAVPEYPNNCYDWAGGGAERAPASDISKSLIRNAAEQLPLRALKDSNEAWAAAGGGATPGLSPKCPNAATRALAGALAARSLGSLCPERGSAASLGELAFRPPSPIDLRRSIDQALCRQHLLREGLFGRPRRGSSGASLRPGALPRCSSLTELPAPRAAPVAAATSASSLESSSLHISWNPWRHGLSSPESPAPDEAPSRAPLLARPAGAARAPDSEREARRSFLALSKQVDSRSLSSDTIEL